MSGYGGSILVALARGRMTAREIAFETDTTEAVARGYIAYHLKTIPPNVRVDGDEISEKTGKKVTIYAIAA